MFTTFLCSLLPLLFCPAAHAHTMPIGSWPQPNEVSEWSIQTQTTPASSSEVIVKSGTDASSTTIMLNAPYGVRSEIVSENGQTYATTTPLTGPDVEQMQEQQAASEKQMEQIFQDQQKLFNDMQANFPF